MHKSEFSHCSFWFIFKCKCPSGGLLWNCLNELVLYQGVSGWLWATTLSRCWTGSEQDLQVSLQQHLQHLSQCVSVCVCGRVLLWLCGQTLVCYHCCEDISTNTYRWWRLVCLCCTCLSAPVSLSLPGLSETCWKDEQTSLTTVPSETFHIDVYFTGTPGPGYTLCHLSSTW